MNKFDRALIELRVLRQRVDVLEAALAARPGPRKRERAPRPSDAVVAARETLWGRYNDLEMPYGHGRMKYTKLAFAIRHRLNPDEFCRFFSATDRRGIPEGSDPALRFYRALTDAIAELEARKNNCDNVTIVSHGKMARSQNSGAHLH